MAVKKRGPGRPQLHKKGTRLMVIRVPEEVGTVIEGVISRVKVLEGDVRIPTPYVLIEARSNAFSALSTCNKANHFEQ